MKTLDYIQFLMAAILDFDKSKMANHAYYANSNS